jgi:hypothetical protein
MSIAAPKTGCRHRFPEQGLAGFLVADGHLSYFRKELIKNGNFFLFS